MKQISKIVLCGGPSGGKTEALRMLKTELEKLGVDVFLVDEAAAGLSTEGFDRSEDYLFQIAIADRQMKLESAAANAAERDALIICDRGLMDAKVYLNDVQYEKFKTEIGLSDIELRDSYDAAFFMQSTSEDDSLDYATDAVRIESRDLARQINRRALKAWCGNPHFRLIPVQPHYSQKLERLLKEVKAFLGIPKPLEIERKYLIKYTDVNFLLNQICSKCEIEQSYLIGKDGKYRLRRRGSDGHYIYIKTVKKKITETVREEKEDRITENEYNALLSSDLVTGTISKDRYSLLYKGKLFEIDVFPFWKNQAYLEIELLNEDEDFELPDFIEVIREVTFDARYKNSSLCQRIPEEDKY